jgi:hypothetical protein
VHQSRSRDEYGEWHLGLTDGAGDDTKARYAFVFGDFRRLHRTGPIACVCRASEWRHKDVELAAQELLQYQDNKAGLEQPRRRTALLRPLPAALAVARSCTSARRTPEPDTDTDDRAAEADEPLRELHLVVDTDPAQQVGRVGTAGREEPASGVPST